MALDLPFMQFYVADWTADAALSICSPATRGVWIDLLCAMHQLGRSGKLSGTRDQLARLGRCSTAELSQALTELQTSRAAEVTERNGVVTVTNRRMARDAAIREGAAQRSKRYRDASRDRSRDGPEEPEAEGERHARVTPDVTRISRPRVQSTEYRVHTNQPANQSGGARAGPVDSSDSDTGWLAGWEPGMSVLRQAGVLIAVTLATEARESGRDPVEWAALARSAVATAAANAGKLDDQAGAIVSFMRRGVWPLQGIVSPEEASRREAKREVKRANEQADHAEFARVQTLRTIVGRGRKSGESRDAIRTRLLQAGLPADWLKDRGWGEEDTTNTEVSTDGNQSRKAS